MKAKGQLQHHFWGTYSATVVLQFDSAIDAAVVLDTPDFAGWHTHKAHADVLVFHGSNPALTKVEKTLVKYGADRKKIASLAKSIDFGEPFTVTIPNFKELEPAAANQADLLEAL